MPNGLKLQQHVAVPTAEPYTPYTVRELNLLAEYLAKELAFSPFLARSHGALWYQQQIGANMANEENVEILRRLTIHHCELGVPVWQQLRRYSDPAPVDWTDQHRVVATLLLLALAILVVAWVCRDPLIADPPQPSNVSSISTMAVSR